MGQKEKAKEVVEDIIKCQTPEGSFEDARTSITRSCGTSLYIETTSLALLCMLRVDYAQWTVQIRKAVDFLMKRMNSGYFGSTQATILAMKALIEYLKMSKSPSDDLQFEVILNEYAYLMDVGDKMKHPDKGTCSG